LHQGVIQQIGSPSEIYHKPANISVARFVGSPQMNLLEGRLDEDGVSFHSGELRLDLSGLFQRPLSRLAGQALTLGIRAEDLQPTGDQKGWLHGEVELVEDLGSDRFVHLKCDHSDLVARAGRELVLLRGETIGLTAMPSQIHFFQGGRRIDP
jgi:ABC-type sugar transport system ATPase subunit